MRILIAVTMLVALSSFVQGQESRPAPRLVLRDIDGRTLRLSDYRGRVVLLNFWATWCAPCRAEMPDLIRWQRKYKNRGLQIIGITYPPEKLRDVRSFSRRIKVNYPIAMGTTDTKSQFDDGDTLPITVVIDRKGIIREVIQGVLFEDEFEEKIEPILTRAGPRAFAANRFRDNSHP